MSQLREVPIETVVKRLDDIKAYLRQEAELPADSRVPTARMHQMFGQQLGELHKRFLKRVGVQR